MNCRTIAILLIPAFFTLEAQSLANDHEITKDEEREAIQIAKLFYVRMKAHDDLMPLIKELFVDHFPNKLLHMLPAEDSSGYDDETHRNCGLTINEDSWPLSNLESRVIAQVEPKDLQEYYIQSINFWYLLLNYSDFLKKQSNPNTQFKDFIPEEIAKILEGNQNLAISLKIHPDYVVSDDRYKRTPEARIKNVEELRGVIRTLGEAVKILRKSRAGSSKPESPISEGSFQPAVAIDDAGNGCEKMLGSNRFVEVYLPLYLHLHLVKENGRLKIFYVDLPTD